MPEKRVHVWVQEFKDRKALLLQWLDPDTGRRKSKSAETNDPKEAEDKRADLESDLNNGRYQEASRMTWERFRELLEEEFIAAKRTNTRKNYQAMLDLFERLCNPRMLGGITERTLSLFVVSARKEPGRARGSKGQAPSSIRQRLHLLRAALGWAVRQKLLPRLPAFPQIKVSKKKPQPVPAESFERLVAKAPDAQMRAYLLCGWLGGLRLSEAAALEREPTDKAPYIDSARNRIILPAEFAKADEDQWVPLDSVLQEALEALPRQGRKVFRFEAPDGHTIGLNALSERVVRLARRAGVKLTMHALRRGFGCRYAGKVPAQVLQRLMRHSDIKTTMAFYANVDLAVEEAVRGPACNTSRNSEGSGQREDRGAEAHPLPEQEI